MKHKYKVFHFVNGKQVCEWREKEIKPILYLNDYYNFLDVDRFDNAYGHGKGSKDYIYEVLKKHLKALEIIKEKVSDIDWFKRCSSLGRYNASVPSYKQLTQQEYDILKEVLL